MGNSMFIVRLARGDKSITYPGNGALKRTILSTLMGVLLSGSFGVTSTVENRTIWSCYSHNSPIHFVALYNALRRTSSHISTDQA